MHSSRTTTEGQHRRAGFETVIDENSDVLKPIGNFVDGNWVPHESRRWIDVIDPSTSEAFSRIPDSDASDMTRAIEAARRSFERGDWSRASPSARGRVLWRMSELIEAEAELLAYVEARDAGKPIREAEADIAGVVDTLQYFGGLASKIAGQSLNLPDNQLGIVLKEPIGVVGAITPWNFPLYVAVWKVAAALSAGCSVVLKPSELASLSCLALGGIGRDAGLPPGTLNVVSGFGDPVGSTLASSRDVDMLSFTGSTSTGRLVMRLRSELPGPIQVELGGKSPHLVFEDAKLDQAVNAVAFGAFYCQGENCNAGSRLLISDSIHDEFVERLAEKVRQLRLGPTLDPSTQLGAIISQRQLEKIEGLVSRSIESGVTVVTGARRASAKGCERGFYYEPTVLTNVLPHHEIFQEEVFGPVLTVTRFSDENEAISLANATEYGLAAGLWTSDIGRATRFATQLKSGYVWVNTYNSTPVEAPFGGVKRSGFGRDTGIQAIDSYMSVKTLAIATTNFSDWYSNA
jgi:acyl-CoA reductase-like NAD-dependent aldehyde dehydrogenase